jgi:hypothetical protein
MWPGGTSKELVRLRNPAEKLNHDKQELLPAKFFRFSADPIEAVAEV